MSIILLRVPIEGGQSNIPWSNWRGRMGTALVHCCWHYETEIPCQYHQLKSKFDRIASCLCLSHSNQLLVQSFYIIDGFFPSLDSVNSTCVACRADCHSCTSLDDCIICDDGYEIFKRECHLKCSDRYGVLTSVCLTAQFGMIINLCTLHKINYVVEIIEIFCSSFCWLVVHRSLKK